MPAPNFKWGWLPLVAIPLLLKYDPTREDLSAAEEPVSEIQCFLGIVRGLDKVGNCLLTVPLSWAESMRRAQI